MSLKPYTEYESFFGPKPDGRPVFAATAVIGVVVALLVSSETLVRVFVAFFAWLTLAVIILGPISARRQKAVETHYRRDWCIEHGFTQVAGAPLAPDTPIPPKTKQIRPRRAFKGRMHDLELQIHDVDWWEYRRLASKIGPGGDGGIELSSGFEYLERSRRIVRMTGPTPKVGALRVRELPQRKKGLLAPKLPPAVDNYAGRIGDEVVVPVSSTSFSTRFQLTTDSAASAQHLSDRVDHAALEWIGVNAEGIITRESDLACIAGVWWFVDPSAPDAHALERFPERMAIIARTVSALSV